jgi:hypothetical protein
MTRSLRARTAALLRRIADHLEPPAPTREPAAAPVHDTAALAVAIAGLRERFGSRYTLASWASDRGWAYGTVWASLTRWAGRDSLPTGRTAHAILTQLCADLPADTLRQLRTPAARAALAARAAASDQAA